MSRIYLTYILTAQSKAKTFFTITVLRSVIAAVISILFIFKYSMTYLALIYGTIISQVVMVICLIMVTANLMNLKFNGYDI